jgi:hypothetical protein
VDELIKTVASKVGISAEQAKTAVETVLGFLKAKLPAALGGQIDAAAGGGGGTAPNPADVAKGLGGMFGKS